MEDYRMARCGWIDERLLNGERCYGQWSVLLEKEAIMHVHQSLWTRLEILQTLEHVH